MTQRKNLVTTTAVLLLLGLSVGHAQDSTIGSINKNYMPSPSDMREPFELSIKFTMLLDKGKWKDAYALLAPAAQQGTPFNEWREAEKQRQQISGRLITQVTTHATTSWSTQGDGKTEILVTTHFLRQYKNLSIDCGKYIWMRQSGGPFKLAEIESHYATNEETRNLDEAEQAALKANLKCVDPKQVSKRYLTPAKN